MTEAPTTLARLTCDEPTARRLALYLAESLDPNNCVCAAFADGVGVWRVEIHFRDAPEKAAVRSLAAVAIGEEAAAALVFEPVAAADWVAESLAGLRPVVAGRFVVHGAHDRSQVAANRIGIEIEAALAFGTGHHGTTRSCLLALDDLLKQRRARTVLDLGTGSGVLAIAAARALRRPVTATDIDARALEVARANARRNRTAPLIAFAHGDGCRALLVRGRAPYDLILANVLLGPLKRMAVDIACLAERGGRVILSGLLPEHANAILSIYRAQGLALERRIALEGWVTLVLVKP